MTSVCPVMTQPGADTDNKFLPNSGDFRVGPSHVVGRDFWQKGSPVWNERLGSDSLAALTLQVLGNMEQVRSVWGCSVLGKERRKEGEGNSL